MGSPVDLLRRVFDTYSGCDSYLDTGEVVRVSHVEQVVHEQHLPFETLFARPNRFRYQFTDNDNNNLYVVWTEENEALGWWSIRPQVKRSPSIAHALAGPTGVSGGSAFHVPSLLLPAKPYESSWLATKFGAAEDAGREIIEGIETVKLHVANPSQEFEEHVIPADVLQRLAARGSPPLPKLPATRWEWRSLWIAEADATIRRKVERINFGVYVTVATTTWKPQLNQPIEAGRFDFVPPGAAKA